MNRRIALTLLLAASCFLAAVTSGRKVLAARVPKETCDDCSSCFYWSMYQQKDGDNMVYNRIVRYQGNQPIVETNAFLPASVQHWTKNRCYAGMDPIAIPISDWG